MSKAAYAAERSRSVGVSELPLIATCRDCSLVSIWEPAGDDDEHPHEESMGHEVEVAGLGDLPSDRRIELPGGDADGD